MRELLHQGLSGEMTSELIREGGEGTSPAEIQGRSSPGNGNYRSKGPEAGTGLGSERSSTGAGVAETV